MLEYAKKRAVEIDISLLMYMGAFGEGINGKHIHTYKDGCPKLYRAYKDGMRMTKKRLDSN